MPLFPSPPETPTIGAVATYILGGLIAYSLLARGYLLVARLTTGDPAPDPRQGIPLLIGGCLVAFATIKLAKWVNESEY